MILLWLTSLLSTKDTEEFSFKGEYEIYIKGQFIDGEWVINIHVYAIYFSWGLNKFCTGMKGSFKELVAYYLMLVFNQLTEYNIGGRDKLISLIKGDLE